MSGSRIYGVGTQSSVPAVRGPFFPERQDLHGKVVHGEQQPEVILVFSCQIHFYWQGSVSMRLGI